MEKDERSKRGIILRWQMLRHACTLVGQIQYRGRSEDPTDRGESYPRRIFEWAGEGEIQDVSEGFDADRGRATSNTAPREKQRAWVQMWLKI